MVTTHKRMATARVIAVPAAIVWDSSSPSMPSRTPIPAGATMVSSAVTHASA